MSGIYEQHLANLEKEAFNAYLAQLIEHEDLTDPMQIGITKQVIAKGAVSLTSKQRYCFNRDVMAKFPQPECSFCGDTIPFDEAYEHIHERDKCSSCQHSWDKF